MLVHSGFGRKTGSHRRRRTSDCRLTTHLLSAILSLWPQAVKHERIPVRRAPCRREDLVHGFINMLTCPQPFWSSAVASPSATPLWILDLFQVGTPRYPKCRRLPPQRVWHPKCSAGDPALPRWGPRAASLCRRTAKRGLIRPIKRYLQRQDAKEKPVDLRHVSPVRRAAGLLQLLRFTTEVRTRQLLAVR